MKCTAIILAGSRDGEDALCVAGNFPHKALIPVAGQPMLVRVLEALSACTAVGEILVSLADAEAALALSPIADWAGRGKIRLLPAAATPSLSVLAAMEHAGNATPVLVTTADHPLLRPEFIEYFLSRADADTDAAAAVVTQETIETAYPETRRTYMRFRGQAFSGANLFLLRTPAAAGAVAFWRHVEANRKSPLRLLSALGAGAVLRFLSGQLALEQALERLGRKCGAKLSVVTLPFAEAAIDVDKADDLELVTRILQRTENQAGRLT